MIDFVLEDDGEEAVGFELDGFTGTVLSGYFDAGVTLNNARHTRHGETTFGGVDEANRAGSDDGINESHVTAWSLGDYQAEMSTNLRGSQTNAVFHLHGDNHVVNKFLRVWQQDLFGA